MKQYPPTHHRDAEHLREELEIIQKLLRVCVDSLQLANVLETTHTVDVLDMLAERVWENIEPAKALETVLFDEWTVKCEAMKAKEEEEKRAQWEADLPPGAVEAFEQVNAVFKKSGRKSA